MYGSAHNTVACVVRGTINAHMATPPANLRWAQSWVVTERLARPKHRVCVYGTAVVPSPSMP
jgi:hypothetical protein